MNEQAIISRDELNYLNMSEIKSLARQFNLPIYIHYENKRHEILKTSEIERKAYLLDKIYAYIKGKRSFKPLVYPKHIVKMGEFKKRYKPEDLVLYGEFKSTNKVLIECLKKMTNNKFRFGAIAFIEVHKMWRKGETITIKQYASIWLREMEKHKMPLKEWAYLTDIKNGFDQRSWKDYRKQKAEHIISTLSVLI